MAPERVHRRLAAILAADVVGYSRLIEADDAGTRARLRSLHSELIDPRIAADGGRIVKTTGDGILVEFASAVDAVRNALAIQLAMAERNADPNLDIYTAGTQAMLGQWVVTAAQMDNLVKTYRRCHPRPPRQAPGGAYAVIRYPPAERRCAPWFFERRGDAWTLDLTMMQRAIRFNHDNHWRLDPDVEHPYGFGFEDWRFDRHGFPRITK